MRLPGLEVFRAPKVREFRKLCDIIDGRVAYYGITIANNKAKADADDVMLQIQKALGDSVGVIAISEKGKHHLHSLMGVDPFLVQMDIVRAKEYTVGVSYDFHIDWKRLETVDDITNWILYIAQQGKQFQQKYAPTPMGRRIPRYLCALGHRVYCSLRNCRNGVKFHSAKKNCKSLV